MWSLGAVLELDNRTKLAEFFTKLPVKMDWPGGKSKEWIMPFEYTVTPAGMWQHWLVNGLRSKQLESEPQSFIPICKISRRDCIMCKKARDDNVGWIM